MADILLVEDSPADQKLFAEAFEQYASDFRIHLARDGAEALDFVHQRGAFEHAPRPKLVLLDLSLPCRDGREVLREIKETPHLRSIPVVVLSGSDNEEDIETCYRLSANSYVVKPRDLDRFFDMIDSFRSYWFRTVTIATQ